MIRSSDRAIYDVTCSPAEAECVLIPVPWDATCSYRRGAAAGPEAIVSASDQVDLFDVDFGDPSARGIAMLAVSEEIRSANEEARRLVSRALRAGSSERERRQLSDFVDAASEKVEAWVRDTTETWLDRGKLVGIVGGDHSVPLGALVALGRRIDRFGILHVDAHADLRPSYQGFSQSHASIMDNALSRVPAVVRIVQVGVRDLCRQEFEAIQSSGGRVHSFFDTELAAARARGATWADQCSDIVDALPNRVYLSIDIDGLDPALCPGTGTPVPGGLSFHQLCFLLHSVVDSGRTIIGFDLCEVAPREGDGEWNANVGARVLYKLIGGALKSQSSKPVLDG